MEAERASGGGDVATQVERGLELLRRAHRYACDVDRDVWQFAVEIDRLAQAGLSRCDMRWMLAKGYMVSAREVTQPSDERRRFIAQGGLGLSDDVCFVLAADVAADLDRAPPHDDRAEVVERPEWDPMLRELRVGSAVVKRFRVPAPNQELILSAFDEEDWSRRIDDPLPQVPNISPKRRLQAAIMCLNRNQRVALIRFRGNGRGDGISWELRSSAE